MSRCTVLYLYFYFMYLFRGKKKSAPLQLCWNLLENLSACPRVKSLDAKGGNACRSSHVHELGLSGQLSLSKRASCGQISQTQCVEQMPCMAFLCMIRWPFQLPNTYGKVLCLHSVAVNIAWLLRVCNGPSFSGSSWSELVGGGFKSIHVGLRCRAKDVLQ